MRNRSTLSRIDDWLLVAVITVVGAFLVFNVIGWLMGAVMFLVKLAIVAAIAGVAVKAISSRRAREVGGGRRRSLHR
jgi:hypothetical protein